MLSVPDVIHVMRSKASPDETQEIGCALCCQPRRSIGVVKDVQMPERTVNICQYTFKDPKLDARWIICI